ncbi:AAA family ATPase [Halospeciosus flavus]|uniref:AAA family ATPase n=1 Tax=Halospeciosus flavus TaxID=3032283 RepID=A0ABD5Z247_9EURY|nr:AAA family ATPase [Halospeciosus flavus]
MGRLVLFCGPPGAGKTTLADRVAERLREEGYAPTVLHSDDFSRNTYDQLAERAGAALDAGDEPVVVDGTFYERARALPRTRLAVRRPRYRGPRHLSAAKLGA